MLGGTHYWLVLAIGAGWAACAPARVRETGLAILAFTLVLTHDVVAGFSYLGVALVVWFLIREGKAPTRRAAAAIIALALGLLGCEWLEYYGNGVWHTPLGLSYLIFRLIHVVVDSRRGALKRVPGASEFFHFLFTPALFVAGPLERWGHWDQRPEEPHGQLVAEGVWRLLIGLLKKLYVADTLLPWLALQSGWFLPELATPMHATGELWQACLYAYLKIYAEFSGYSDMAVGAALLWGRRPMENFNWPIIAATPADFWRRWHISIAQWCSDCVYLPVMGLMRSVVVPMLASFVIMGQWHGLGWNRLGWAVWQVGGLLVFITWQKKWGRPKAGHWRSGWTWRIASIAMTQAFVVASYVFMLHGEPFRVGKSAVMLVRMLGWSP